MKLHLPKRLLLAVLAACGAFVPSVYAAVSTEAKTKTDETGKTINYNVYTWTGSDSVNNNFSDKLDEYSQDDEVIFQLSNPSSNTNNYLEQNEKTCYAHSIQILDDSETTELEGLILNNGWGNTHQIFTGILTGDGIIKKTYKGTGVKLTFEGDATGYEGDIHMHADSNGRHFELTFGSHSYTNLATESAVSAAATTELKGVAGTGDVKFANAENTLRFNFAAAETPVYITNAITDANTGSTDNSKLVLMGGADYILTKAITIDQITLSANSSATFNNALTVAGASNFGGAVTINSTAVFDGAVTLSQTWENEGSVTFNGRLTLNLSDVSSLGSEVSNCYVIRTADGDVVSDNGYYSVDREIIVVNGDVSLGANFTFSGAKDVQLGGDGGLHATVADVDTTVFHVNTGTVTISDMTATSYWVKNGATLNLNGRDFAGKKLILDGGATVTNTGTSFDDNARQMDAITLNGDADINLDNNHGLIASSWNASNLTLNGHTLTKKGDSIFYLINTTVDAGTIRIEEGTVQIGADRTTLRTTNASNTLFDMKGGTIRLEKGKLIAAGLTGTAGSVTYSDNASSL